MKKLISIMLAVILLISSTVSIYITETTAASVNETITLTDPNLAKDYTVANGSVVLDSNSSPWATSGSMDFTDGTTLYGSAGGSKYSWKLGTTSAVGKNIINANGLEPNTKYYFSYVYSNDFNLVFDGVKDSNDQYVFEGYTADSGTVSYPSGVTVTDLTSDGRRKKVQFYFTTNTSTDYDIILKTHKNNWQNVNWNWECVILSDLVLSKVGGNLAADYEYKEDGTGNIVIPTEANLVTQTANTITHTVNGGKSFRMKGAATNTEVHVIIKADDLKANTVYNFSWVYANDYKVQLKSSDPVLYTKDAKGNENIVVTSSSVVTKAISGGQGAVLSSFSFTTLGAGDYTIALVFAKGWMNPSDPTNQNWDSTYLSDIRLTEKGANDDNLIADYTIADGEITYTNKNGIWDNDVYGGQYTGYWWKLPYIDQDPDFAFNIKLKAEDIEPNTYYLLTYNCGSDLYTKVNTEKTTGVTVLTDRSGEASSSVVIKTGEDVSNCVISLKYAKEAYSGAASGQWAGAVISNLCLTKRTGSYSLSATADGNGTATVEKTTASVGEKVKFTAVPKRLESFLGWYDENDRLLSEDAEYNLEVYDETNATAKFTSVNLASDYSKAYGDISWSANAGNTNSDAALGYYDQSYAWDFDINGTTKNDAATITINADGLAEKTLYEFSYVYSGGFAINKGTVTFDGNPVSVVTEASDEVISADKHIVTFRFATDKAGDYKISLNTCRDYVNIQNNGADDFVRLSDLALYRIRSVTEDGENIAADYTNENGAITWTDNAEPHFKDSKSNSLYGGYSWGFGVSRTDATQNNFAYIYIRAKELEANTNYTFSYYYSEDFIIKYDSVKNPAGQKVTDITTPVAVYCDGFATARKVSFDFKTDAEGEYLITLKTAKYLNNIPCNWSKTVLSDLSLVKQDRELSYDNIAEFYSGNQSGHGSGNFTFSNVGTVKAENSRSVEGFKSVAWCFGIDHTNSEGDPKDAAASTNKAYFNLLLENLEANTTYDFSYVYGKDYIVKLLDTGKITNMQTGKAVEYSVPTNTEYPTGDRTYQVKTTFTTTTAGDYLVVLESCKGAGYRNDSCSWDAVTIGDFSLTRTIIDGVNGTVKGSFGGTATSNFKDGFYPKNATITVTAKVGEANAFVGWYDDNDNLVSNQNPYSFKTDKDFDLIAKFTGNNMDTYDYLTDLGFDGTFENGTVSGWSAEDRWAGGDPVPSRWCTFKRNKAVVYDGNYSLRFDANHQVAFLKLKNLAAESDYRVSFYINMPGYAENSKIQSFGVTNEEGGLFSTGSSWISAGSGWHRVDAYFNSGSITEAQLEFHIQGYSSTVNGQDVTDKYFYIDNLEISQYQANDKLSKWQGTSVIKDDAILLNNKGDIARQTVSLQENAKYTVSFKAKGEILAGIYDIKQYLPDDTNLITSLSKAVTDSNKWQSYSFEFFTSEHKAANLAFVALEASAQVKDIKLVKKESRMGAIVEKVDFETTRFALKNSDKNVFSVYEKASSNDKNVYDGKNSLFFDYSKVEDGKNYILDEAFLSNQVIKGGSYRLTLYYKAAEGKNSGSIFITPEMRNTLCGDLGYEHTAKDKGWNKLEFSFTNKDYTILKTIIGNILKKTKGSFYIDDITLTIVRPFVTETNVKEKYTAAVYNFIENHNFENKITNSNFKNLPKTIEVVTGDAEQNERFIKVKAGTNYVLPIRVRENAEYIFSAAVRGKKAKGYIGIAATADGKELFTDYNDTPASFISPSSKDWQRTGFRFSSEESGYVYLVIKCTDGSFDVDNLMLYMSEFGFAEDPNDYSVVVPYDYDAVTGETIILNGGQKLEIEAEKEEEITVNDDLSADSQDDTYKDEQSADSDDAVDSPATYDVGIKEAALPLFVLSLSVIAVLLVLGKKEKRRSF